MRGRAQRLGLLVAGSLLTLPMCADAQETIRLAFSKKLGVEILAEAQRGDWCREALGLVFLTQDRAFFESQQAQTLVLKVGKIVIEKDCAKAEAATIVGVDAASRKELFRGVTDKNSGWKMREAAATAKQILLARRALAELETIKSTDGIQGLKAILNKRLRLRNAIGNEELLAETRTFDEVAAKRGAAIVANDLPIYREDLSSIAESFDGLTSAKTAFATRRPFVEELTPEYLVEYEQASQQRYDEITDALVAKAHAEIDEFQAEWRNVGGALAVAKRHKSAFDRAGLGPRSNDFTKRALLRAFVLLQDQIPTFKEELAAIPDSWDGFGKLNVTGTSVDEIGKLASGAQQAGLEPSDSLILQSYSDEVASRRQSLIAAIKANALDQISQWSGNWVEIATVVELAQDLAERFEEEGYEDDAAAIRTAGTVKASSTVESRVAEYRRQLHELGASRENTAELRASAMEFEELAASVNTFRLYAAAAVSRADEMQGAICLNAQERAGISEEDGVLPVQGSDSIITLQQLVCGLDAGGHEARVFKKPQFLGLVGGGYQLKLVRSDQMLETITFEMKEVLPDQEALVGISVSDPDTETKLKLVDWKQYVGKMSVDRVAVARRCDVLAAHAADPTKTGSGVSDEEMDAKAALDACRSAVELYPDTPRFSFQLGRAFYVENRFGDAAAQFVIAAEQDHQPARAYLGELLLDGTSGLEPDVALGISLMTEAAENGFGPAETRLAAASGRLCDLYAAHPKDPAKPQEIPGVADEDIEQQAALQFCGLAAESSNDADDEGRYRFQLGRTHLAAGREEEASAEFRKAADAGHAAGVAYYADTLDNDKDRLSLYRQSANAGFEPAKAVVAEFARLEQEERARKRAEKLSQPPTDNEIQAAINRFFSSRGLPGEDAPDNPLAPLFRLMGESVRHMRVEEIETITCGRHWQYEGHFNCEFWASTNAASNPAFSHPFVNGLVGDESYRQKGRFYRDKRGEWVYVPPRH